MTCLSQLNLQNSSVKTSEHIFPYYWQNKLGGPPKTNRIIPFSQNTYNIEANDDTKEIRQCAPLFLRSNHIMTQPMAILTLTLKYVLLNKKARLSIYLNKFTSCKNLKQIALENSAY